MGAKQRFKRDSELDRHPSYFRTRPRGEFAQTCRKLRGRFPSIVFPEEAVSFTQDKEKVTVALESGRIYEAGSLLLAPGATRRKLEIPGAIEYDQKGLTYCATCDGPLFEGKDVAVIGGGNAAFETSAQLLAYCKTVTLLIRSGAFRADEIIVRAVLAHSNIRVIKNAIPTEVIGGNLLQVLNGRTLLELKISFPSREFLSRSDYYQTRRGLKTR